MRSPLNRCIPLSLVCECPICLLVRAGSKCAKCAERRKAATKPYAKIKSIKRCKSYFLYKSTPMNRRGGCPHPPIPIQEASVAMAETCHLLKFPIIMLCISRNSHFSVCFWVRFFRPRCFCVFFCVRNILKIAAYIKKWACTRKQFMKFAVFFKKIAKRDFL